jgi:hypothetical protein
MFVVHAIETTIALESGLLIDPVLYDLIHGPNEVYIQNIGQQLDDLIHGPQIEFIQNIVPTSSHCLSSSVRNLGYNIIAKEWTFTFVVDIQSSPLLRNLVYFTQEQNVCYRSVSRDSILLHW